MFSILIFEKDRNWRKTLTDALQKSYAIQFRPDGPGSKDIYDELRARQFNLVFVDLSFDEVEPFGLVRWISTNYPETVVIVSSREEKAELVVRALRAGAYDFLVQTQSLSKIRITVQKAQENHSLKNEIDYLRRQQDIIYDFDKIIAVGPEMKSVVDQLKKFSRTDSTILMRGETGTGKSYLSGTIHFNSSRRHKPFVKINCSNIPESLLESELYGHEKGAFTGAEKMRIGRIEQADGGTVFLDEIAEMKPTLQAKMLRVLEDRAFERVGGNQTIYSDIRIITATNRNLEDYISEGNFRSDLYFRINILTVTLPPLRHRKECIEPMSLFFLDKMNSSLKKKIKGFSRQVMEMFKDYSWPGNIRELSNTIERACILTEEPFVLPENVLLRGPFHTVKATPKMAEPEPSGEVFIQPLDRQERDLIIKALEKSLWIQKDAAQLLSISPRTLNYKIKKYGITHSRWRKNT